MLKCLSCKISWKNLWNDFNLQRIGKIYAIFYFIFCYKFAEQIITKIDFQGGGIDYWNMIIKFDEDIFYKIDLISINV